MFSASCKSVTGAWLKADSRFIKVRFLDQENEVVFELVNCITYFDLSLLSVLGIDLNYFHISFCSDAFLLLSYA